MNVVIRADASITIGMGHISRCLALAEEFRCIGARVHFVSRVAKGQESWQIEESGFALHRLSMCADNLEADQTCYETRLCGFVENDAKGTLEIIKSLDDDTDYLIVDHYGLDACWERALYASVKRIVVIDDLANRPHNCNLLVDPNPNRTIKDYSNLLPSNAKVLCGLDYAMLRPEFSIYRSGLANRRSSLKRINRILLNFGGSDQKNYTLQCLKALARSKRSYSVDVVLGVLNPHVNAIAALAKTSENVRLHLDTQVMAKIMMDVDVAIGAVGTTAWERCCIGLPTIICPVSDNQQIFAQWLGHAGVGIVSDYDSIGDPDRLEAMLDLIEADYDHMSTNALMLVDGKGAKRIREEILKIQEPYL